MSPNLFLSLGLGLLSFAKAQNDSASDLPAVLTTDIIDGLGNNSLFTRWRPTYHFIAPAGWLNVSSGCTLSLFSLCSLVYTGPLWYDV